MVRKNLLSGEAIPIRAIFEGINWLASFGAKLCEQGFVPVQALQWHGEVVGRCALIVDIVEF